MQRSRRRQPLSRGHQVRQSRLHPRSRPNRRRSRLRPRRQAHSQITEQSHGRRSLPQRHRPPRLNSIRTRQRRRNRRPGSRRRPHISTRRHQEARPRIPRRNPRKTLTRPRPLAERPSRDRIHLHGSQPDLKLNDRPIRRPRRKSHVQSLMHLTVPPPPLKRRTASERTH